MNTKPTKAQIELLASLALRTAWVADYYKPGQIAVKNGWAVRNKSGRLEIAEAGRAVLKSRSQQPGKIE